MICRPGHLARTGGVSVMRWAKAGSGGCWDDLALASPKARAASDKNSPTTPEPARDGREV